MAGRSLVSTLTEAQKIVDEEDVTWAFALRELYRHHAMSKLTYSRAFRLCLDHAGPKIDTNTVIPLVLNDLSLKARGVR